MARTYEMDGVKYVSNAWNDIEMALLEKRIHALSDGVIHPLNIGEGWRAPIRMGLNWAAIGRVPVEDATRFADAITQAAKLASEYKYNGYTVDYEKTFDRLPESEQEEIRAIIKANQG